MELNVCTTVTDPGGRSEQHRRAVFFRVCKGVLDHFIGFLRGGGIKHRQLCELGEVPGILLGLGGDGPRIVCGNDDHAPLDAYIGKAHQRVGRHVQPYLLHGDQGACPGVGCAGSHLQCSLFVDGPLYIYGAVIALGNRLQDLRRGCAGVSCHQVYAGVQCAHGDGGIAH